MLKTKVETSIANQKTHNQVRQCTFFTRIQGTLLYCKKRWKNLDPFHKDKKFAYSTSWSSAAFNYFSGTLSKKCPEFILKQLMNYFQRVLRLFMAPVVSKFFYTFVYGILPFLPLCVGLGKNFDRYENAEVLSAAINSWSVRYCWIATIAASSPFLIDLVLDYLSSFEDKPAISRLKILIIILVSDIFLLAYVLPTNSLSLMPCIYRARELLIIISVISYAREYFFDWGKSNFAVAIINISAAVCVLRAFVPFFDPISNTVYTMEIIILILEVLVSILFLWAFYSSIHTTVAAFDDNATYFPYRHIMLRSYMIAAILFIIGLYTIAFTIGNTTWKNTSTSFLTSYSIILLLYALITTLSNIRMMRLEAAFTKVNYDSIIRSILYLI